MNIPTDHRFKNLTGRTFGRLRVIEYVGYPGKGKYWKCQCQCGTVKIVFGSSLIGGLTNSCGCLHREVVSKHGGSKSREYASWLGIIGRTSNPNNSAWNNYGGRGIKMCDRWRKSFAAFLEDMGPRPPGHTIELKNNNGNYEPSNCVWLPKVLQTRNTRRTRLISCDGKTQILSDWTRETGLPECTIIYRLNHGWSVEDALHTPTKHSASNIESAAAQTEISLSDRR